MSLEFEATYRDGTVHPESPLDLPNNMPVHVQLIPKTPQEGAAAPLAGETPRLTPPQSPRITVEEFKALVEKYSVSVGTLPPDFSRADIYSDHD